MSLFRYLFIFFALTTTLFTYAAEPVPVQGKLENGLRWTILPLNKQKDRVDVIIRVYAGGIDETPQQSGVAHMVEHMVFRATKDHSEGIMTYLLNSGWLRGRNYNAYTTHDHTTYLYFPPKTFGLEKTLATAAQMLFAAEINAQELEDERKIVLEEWRMRDGVKRRLWQKRINSNRYASRYENRPVIGTEQSIKETPVEQLKHYYQDWYVPNNMQILLVGDITPQQGEKLIQQYFGKYASKTLPERNGDYYEPKLQKQLRIDRLSDPQNTQSQVAFLYRFNDAASQVQDENGRRERLINDLALRLINQYFRAEKANLPIQITNVSAQKQPIGKQSSVFLLNANIEKQAHHQAVQYLMLQAQRLKQYPFKTDELERQKQKLLEQTKNKRNNNINYTFEDWTQEMISTLLNDKNYYSQTEIERFVLQTLPTIKIEEINARIQYWLASEDQIIQYMPPLTVEVADINEEMAANWLEQAKNEAIASPITDLSKEELAFPALQEKGNITKEAEYPKQNLVHWTLSNGDNVFWLKSPTAGSKTYFLAQSEAGSYGKGLTDWQAKLAIQLIGKNAPNDWQFEQLKEWKETLGIPLVMRMPFNRFNLLSTVENDKLPHLLRYYYANQQETDIKENFEKEKRELIRRIDLQNRSEESKKTLAWETFVYGHPINSRPTIEEVEKLEPEVLEQQWQKIKQAPVTFFLINNLEKDDVKENVINHLGTLSRKEPLPAKPLLVLKGEAEKVYPYNPENRDNIYLSFFQPHNWSVREEMKVKLLSIMTSQKMLHKLRDQTQGVYGAKTTVKLTKETDRLHTVISFSAEPKQSRQLITMAKSVLQDLPQLLTITDFERVKKHVIEKNEQALKTAEGYLERLVYAVTYAQDPTYLSEADKLIESIRFDEIKELANKVYSEQNRRLFITSAK